MRPQIGFKEGCQAVHVRQNCVQGQALNEALPACEAQNVHSTR